MQDPHQQQQYNYYDPRQNQPPPYPQQDQPPSYYQQQNQPPPYYQQQNQPPPYYQQPPYPQPYPPPVLEPGRGQALAGVILGGIGLIAWLLPLIGYPVSITGLVLAIRGRRSFSRRTMATVGMILCIIALVLTVISSFIGIAAYRSY